MNIVHSDIFSNLSSDNFTVICHQTNCHGVAGAGIARAIRDKFPGWFSTYKSCASPDMLGNAQLYPTNRDYCTWVCNLYGQLDFGRENKCYTDYKALRRALQSLRKWLKQIGIEEDTDYEIRIPYKMGCGLAGGDWSHVSEILETELRGLNWNVYRVF